MRTEIEQLSYHQKQSDSVIAALRSTETAEEVVQDLQNGVTIAVISEKFGGADTCRGKTATDMSLTQSEALPSLGKETVLDRLSLKSPNESGVSPLLPLGQDLWDSSLPSTENQSDGIMNSTSSIVGKSVQDTVVGSPRLLNLLLEARCVGQEAIFGPDIHLDHQIPPREIGTTSSWTRVTSDNALIDHLMALYFCWEYPTFASLSKEYFLADFKSGSTKYCSSLLVNIIVSLGCRFTDDPRARSNPSDVDTVGRHFFEEARRLLKAEDDYRSLTTIQALGLFSLHEASCGNTSQSIYYSQQSIRLAIEMGLHSNDHHGDLDVTVRNVTFWGAFTLDEAWSLCIGQLPRFSREIRTVGIPSDDQQLEDSIWLPYTDDGGVPIHEFAVQPSNLRSVYTTFCQLSEVIHASLYLLYTPGEHITSKKLVDVYTRFLTWYDGIPVALRLGHNSTPTILFAHMHYHWAILLLFRPFIKLQLANSVISPRTICSQASSAIITLITSYSKLYTLRRIPSLVPIHIMTASVTQLYDLGNSHICSPSLYDARQNVLQSYSALKDMKSCHIFAGHAMETLQALTYRWAIKNVIFESLPVCNASSADIRDLESTTRGKHMTKKELQAVCKPRSSCMDTFCVDLDSMSSMKGIKKVNESESEGADAEKEREREIEENPLFWPFPLQGVPFLPCGKEALENAGFRIL